MGTRWTLSTSVAVAVLAACGWHAWGGEPPGAKPPLQGAAGAPKAGEAKPASGRPAAKPSDGKAPQPPARHEPPLLGAAITAVKDPKQSLSVRLASLRIVVEMGRA